MRNLAKVVLATSLVCGSALAYDMFVGFESGIGSYKLNFDSSDQNFKDFFGEEDFKYKATPNFGFKYGGYFNESLRAYVHYNYNFEAKEKEAEDLLKIASHEFLVGADYMPKIASNFKALAGLFVGTTLVQNSGEIADDLLAKSVFGATIGAKLGGAFDIDDKVQVELGLRSSYTKFSDSHLVRNGGFLGLNYKF